MERIALRRLRLNSDLVEQCIQEQFGGMKNFLDGWSEAFESTPHRSTVQKWRKEFRPPSTFLQMMRLCQILQIDPILLSDFGAPIKADLLDYILRIAITKVNLQTPLLSADFFDVFGPQRNWPNNPKLRALRLRDWCTADFKHNGQLCDFYQTIKISHQSMHVPKVWHFAYRSPASDIWRPYGYVQFDKQRGICLNNYYQDEMMYKKISNSSDIYVSTYFGRGVSFFRIASMHSFEVSFSNRSENLIRFKA